MSRQARARLVLVMMVFLGALLGFGIEPLVGRLMVGPFGSAVHVWLTTMMFFQAALFCGYLYAHLIAQRIGRWHLAVLLLPLVFLPPGVEAIPDPGAPLQAVLVALARYILVPFAVVSTTAVVAQTWLARSDLGDEVEPYGLYAASNLGSLVGLIGYPIVVEPLSGLAVQTWMWTAGYLVYVGVAAAAWHIVAPRPLEESQHGAMPPVQDLAGWALLAAIPSAYLLAVTNVIALEVGSLPLIWVLPLAVYLASFIWTFGDGGTRFHALARWWPEVALVALLSFLFVVGTWTMVLLHLALLAALATIAHAELYARRPAPAQLTWFYLAVSLGGWLGGAAVSLGAPVVFDTISEYPVSVLAFVVAMAALSPRWERPPQHVAVAGLRAVGWLVGLVVLIAGYRSWFARESLHASRTFYGTFRVVDEPANDETPVPVRTMRHGATVHGGQARTPEEQANPTAYYRFGQCIHRATSLVPSPRRFGGVGLGVGAVAAYGRPGDAMTFYEIEPTMEAMAREWFSYMDDSKADSVDVIVGDGRLELLASDAEFDVLLIDAFSGDGVPFHLLTVEALQTYLDRLADDGLLVIHVSNRFFDLRRVLEANTAVLDLPAVYNDRPSEEDVGDPLASRPVCVVLSRERGALQPLASSDGWHDLASLGAGIDAWTDDYLNVFAALK